jgi:hypothetical protein
VLYRGLPSKGLDLAIFGKLGPVSWASRFKLGSISSVIGVKMVLPGHQNRSSSKRKKNRTE